MENQKELQIDLLELFHYLKKRVEIILIVTAVFALVAFLVSSFFVVPEYKASTRVYILNRINNQTLVSSDFSIANYMIKDYTILITGRNVTDKVVEKLDLEMSSDELSSKISVTAEENTRVLQISVTDPNPQRAAEIANSVREEASIQIKDIMNVDAVNLVYEASVPTAPFTPDISRNTLTWAGIGLAISVAIFVVIFVLDDAIRTEEDVEHYLGLSVLGVIPASGELETEKVERSADKSKIGGGMKWKK